MTEWMKENEMENSALKRMVAFNRDGKTSLATYQFVDMTWCGKCIDRKVNEQ